MLTHLILYQVFQYLVQVFIHNNKFNLIIYCFIFTLAGACIFLLSCRGKNQAGYTQAEIDASWKRTSQLLTQSFSQDKFQNGELKFLKKLEANSLEDIKNIQNKQGGNIYENIYDKVIGYNPLSFVEAEWVDTQEVVKGAKEPKPKEEEKRTQNINNTNYIRILIFDMGNSMDSYGAYSRMSNENIPVYAHPLLTPPSEGTYLEGLLIIYHGDYLCLIEHSIKQLDLLKSFTTLFLKQMPNQPNQKEIKNNLLSTLPKGGLIQRSQIYTKRKVFKWPHLSECVTGKYAPHGSLQVFICDLKDESKGLSAFNQHIEYVEKDMSLAKPKSLEKEFKRESKVYKVNYFFYNAANYELHGIFHHGAFVFGILGASSEDYALAITNEILDNLNLIKN